MPSSKWWSQVVLLGLILIGTMGLTYIRAYHTVPLQPGRAYFIFAVCQPVIVALISGWYQLGLLTVVTASFIPPVVGTLLFRVLVPYPGSYGLEEFSDAVMIVTLACLIVLTISAGIYTLGRKARSIVGSAVNHT
jgi:hypothetical protein